MSKGILEQAKQTLLALLKAKPSGAQKVGPGGVPADPVAFQAWSIQRHLDAKSKTMHLSRCGERVSSDISKLNPYLRKLTIRHCDVRDISALRGLPALEELEITGAPVSDLSALAEMRQLKRLRLSNIARLPVVVPALPNLEVLELYSTSGDITLGALPALKRAKFKEMDELSILKGLTHLQELVVWELRGDSLGALRELPNLRAFECNANRVSDISPIKALQQLERLSLSVPQVSDMSPLSELKPLTALELRGMDFAQEGAVARLSSGLQGLTMLRTLRLVMDAKVLDLAFLEKMQSLEEFILCPHTDADLGPLAALPKLKSLLLRDLDLNMDLSALSDCASLERLSLLSDSETRAQTPKVLPAPRLLTSLTLRGAGFDSLSGLEGCLQLESLMCDSTGISDLSPLSGLAHLKQMDLAKTQVSDLSVLAELPCFAERQKGIRLALRDTPALEQYPALRATVSQENGRDALAWQSETADTAVALVLEQLDS